MMKNWIRIATFIGCLLIFVSVTFAVTSTDVSQESATAEEIKSQTDSSNVTQVTPRAIKRKNFQVRSKILELKSERQESKKAFLNSKNQLIRLKNLKQATGEAKEKTLDHAKKFILKAIDQAVAKLQRIIGRVQKSKISDERKDKLVSAFEEKISVLHVVQDKVENASSFEELKESIREARGEIFAARKLIKSIVAEILASHIDKTIVKIEEIVEKVGSLIDELEAQGVDTASFKASLDEAMTKIEEAKEANTDGDYKSARRAIEKARTILVKLRGQLVAAGAKLKDRSPQGTKEAEL